MEVAGKISKDLHKHSLPIFIVLSGIMILSIAVFSYYSAPGDSSVLRHALVGRLVNVSPTRDGLARVSINHASNVASQQPKPTLGAQGETVGGTAQLNLAIEQDSQN